jgi:hypothetical protein
MRHTRRKWSGSVARRFGGGGDVCGIRGVAAYLPLFRFGAALLLARRPTLVAPFARAWRANFARAAACFLVAIGGIPLYWRTGAGSKWQPLKTRPGDGLGCAAQVARWALATCAVCGQLGGTGHGATGLPARRHRCRC